MKQLVRNHKYILLGLLIILAFCLFDSVRVFKQSTAGESLVTAVMKNDQAKAKRLLDANISPNSEFEGLSALMASIEEDNVEMAKLLIRYGADVSMRSGRNDLRPFDAAKSDEMKLLLKQ